MKLWVHLRWRYHVEAARRALARWHRHSAQADALDRQLDGRDVE